MIYIYVLVLHTFFVIVFRNLGMFCVECVFQVFMSLPIFSNFPHRCSLCQSLFLREVSGETSIFISAARPISSCIQCVIEMCTCTFVSLGK